VTCICVPAQQVDWLAEFSHAEVLASPFDLRVMQLVLIWGLHDDQCPENRSVIMNLPVWKIQAVFLLRSLDNPLSSQGESDIGIGSQVPGVHDV
jgi:hypothetical protein